VQVSMRRREKRRNLGSPWALPPLNSDAERVRAASSLASGILAGFSVTAIASLITADRKPWLFEPTLLVFSIAASTALLALNYQSWAQGYWSGPNDFLEWRPRARINFEDLQQVRRVQYNNMSIYRSLSVKADGCFRIAAAAFFLGLILLLCPNLKAGHISIWRLVSMGSVALGLIMFVATSTLYKSPVFGRRLLAQELYGDLPQVPPPTDEDIEAVALDGEAATRMKQARTSTLMISVKPREVRPVEPERVRRIGPCGMFRYKPSTEAEHKYEADLVDAAKRPELLDAAHEAESQLRQAQARRAPETEIRRLAEDLDKALTAAMRAAYAAQRAEIGPRGYEDRIYRRKAKATPRVHALTAEAERLLTLRETHRLNGIPAVTLKPSPPPSSASEA
jgi:hypothetical protein